MDYHVQSVSGPVRRAHWSVVVHRPQAAQSQLERVDASRVTLLPRVTFPGAPPARPGGRPRLQSHGGRAQPQLEHAG